MKRYLYEIVYSDGCPVRGFDYMPRTLAERMAKDFRKDYQLQHGHSERFRAIKMRPYYITKDGTLKRF